MSEADVQLLLTALGGVALLVALIVTRIRLHPLIALLVVSLAVGIFAGMDIGSIAGATVAGAGHTLGVVGMVIALGAMLGKILADSGVTETIADAILNRSSDNMLPWAMAFAAFVVGIPMFFEVGLVVLLPLIFSVARKLEQRHGQRFVLRAFGSSGDRGSRIAARYGAAPSGAADRDRHVEDKCRTDHGLRFHFRDPRDHPRRSGLCAVYRAANDGTPGPGAARAVHRVRRAGLLGRRNACGDTESPCRGRYSRCTDAGDPDVGQYLRRDASSQDFLGCEGHRVSRRSHDCHARRRALRLDHLVYWRGGSTEKLREALGASLKPIAGILLIIAGGGAFQQVLVKAKVGDAIVHLTQHFSLPPLLLGWLIAMLLSVSTGSATVGIVGAAGLLAPLATADPLLNLPLLALAIGSGSLFFNYANHAGFWLVKESFGMTMGEATLTISVIQSIVALVGLGMVLLMNLFPALPS